MQQLFFGRQLGLGLGRDFADENVARLHPRPDADDPLFVEVTQGLFADVGNVASELLAAELRLANFDVELVDVDRRINVVRHQSFGQDDRVLEVVPFPRHEGHERVAAQRQFAVASGGAIAKHFPLLHPLVHLDDRPSD